MTVLETEPFETFYRARSEWLVRALRSIVGGDAEDVAQDAFAILFQRWDAISRYDSPEAWLRRVAFRAALRHRRRTVDRPRREVLSTVAGVTTAGVEPTSVLLHDALTPLTASEREALLLRYLSDRPIAEIAERFGCSEGTMRVRLHRACIRAREQLIGLTGTWIRDVTLTRPGLEQLLRDGGYESSLEPVMDNLDGLGAIRTQLQLAGGRFLLTNGPDEHLDHGTYALTKRGLRLDSAGYSGGVTHEVTLEGDSLTLRQVENHNPVVHGAPDDAFQLALVASSSFTWHPVAS